MEEKKELDITNKHIYSLASVMLFAPLIPVILKNNNDQDFTQQDINFIKSYIKYGMIIDAFLLISAILRIIIVLNHFENYFFSIITNILVGVSICMIVIGIFFIFSDKQILKVTSGESQVFYKPIKSGNIEFIFYFLPLYNFFVWYFGEKTKKNYRWLKESILISFFWVLMYFITFSNYINTIFILLIIGRTISLIGGIDILPDNYKEKFDKLFDNNPEEIFGYIKGLIVYFFDKIKYKGKELTKSPIEYINEAKKGYSYIYSYNKNINTIIEYVLLFIVFGFTIYYLLYLFYNEISYLLMMIPSIIFLGRYIILFMNKKIIPIPLFHEIGIYLSKLFKFIK